MNGPLSLPCSSGLAAVYQLSQRRHAANHPCVKRNLPTVIERNVTIGHSAQLEGCVVEEGALVGMGATMLQRSRLGAGSMLAAGSVLREGSEVPPGHLAAGVPASVKKELDGSSRGWVENSARHYRERAIAYRAELRIARP